MSWFAGLRRPHLSRDHFDQVARRLHLDPATLVAAPRDEALVALLMTACHHYIPFDTSRIHIREADPSLLPVLAPIGKSRTVTFDETFDLIINHNRGATCFQLNVLLSATYRYLGYRVDELPGRSNNGFPAPKFDWSLLEHVGLFVHVGEQRWLVDCGWCGNPTLPILVPPDGGSTEQRSLATIETFILKHEPMPLEQDDYGSMIPGYTLYRRHATSVDGYPPTTSACFHLTPTFVSQADIAGCVHVVNSCPLLPLASKLIVTNVLPNGDRQFIVWLKGDDKAEYYVRCGTTAGKLEHEEFPPTNREIYRRMKGKFGLFR